MPFPRPSSPRALLADLRSMLRQRSRSQNFAAVMAIVMPVAIVLAFAYDGGLNMAPRERIIYVESWSADRTDAQIVAEQKRDQALYEARVRERQRQFKALARSLGME